MISEFYLRQDNLGHWRTPGMSHGYGVGNYVEMIERKDRKAIIKIKGAFEWSGVGMETS